MKNIDKKNRFSSLDRALSDALSMVVEENIESALKLSKKEVRMYAALINEPFCTDIRAELELKRFEKGFSNKSSHRALETISRPFHTWWNNRKIQKALKRAGSQNLGDW